MSLTTRGQIVLLIAGVILGLLAGFTAHLWNPLARPVTTTTFEDGSGIVSDPAGQRILTFCTTGALCDNGVIAP